MKPWKKIMIAVLSLVMVWGGYRIYRAHYDLVTLSVRDMEVRKVVSKLEWQTWERILVNKDAGGKVTFDVRNAPLSEVLNIIALQTSTRWTRLYPIYATGNAGDKFQKVVRGDLPAEGNGWANLSKLPGWQGGWRPGFTTATRAANNIVSAQFVNKDVSFAALALSRFSQAQVIPEDNAVGMINLKLEQAPFNKAVSQVAKQVHRKWDEIYAIQTTQQPKVVRKDPAVVVEGDTNEPVKVVKEKKVDELRKPEVQMEAFLATMSPAEREQVQQQMAAQAALANLPPDQARAQMQAMSAQASQNSQADAEKRINDRLKNGTVDQRLAHDRATAGRQNRRETKQ
jgi:hypothetical protein